MSITTSSFTVDAPIQPVAVDEILRDRTAVFTRIERDRDLAGLARAAIVTIFAGAAIFGGAVGAFRGGIQIVYAAIKFPLALLLTAAVCAPALTAITRAVGRATTARQDLARIVCSLAVTALVLAACAPIMVLGALLGDGAVGYHGMALMMAGACAIAGAAGLTTFWRALGASERTGRFTVTAVVLVAFALVGAQMSWTLRPYLVRPRTPDVVFVRDLEGGLIESLHTSFRSARGIYEREAAPLPGEQ